MSRKSPSHRHLENIEELKKTSASSTIQYFARLKGEDVFVKTYLKIIKLDEFTKDVKATLMNVFGDMMSDNDLKKMTARVDASAKNYTTLYAPDIDGLEYESKVYSELISEFTEDEISPNFVEYVDRGEIEFIEFLDTFYAGQFDTSNDDDLIDGLYIMAEKFKKNSLKNFFELQDHESKYRLLQCYMKYVRIGYLVTKRVVGVENNLEKVSVSQVLSEDEIKEILFQLFFTLYLMETVKLQHNDMHYGNILIENLPERRNINYVVEGKSFVVKTKYLLRVYDWDFAYVDDPYFGPNKKLNNKLATEAGVLNEFVENYDYFQIMCNLLLDCSYTKTERNLVSVCKTRIFHDLFSDLIKKGILKVDADGFIGGFEIGGKFITNNPPYTTHCRGNNRAALKELPKLENILMNPVFNQFLVVQGSRRRTSPVHYRAKISKPKSMFMRSQKPSTSQLVPPVVSSRGVDLDDTASSSAPPLPKKRSSTSTPRKEKAEHESAGKPSPELADFLNMFMREDVKRIKLPSVYDKKGRNAPNNIISNFKPIVPPLPIISDDDDEDVVEVKVDKKRKRKSTIDLTEDKSSSPSGGVRVTKDGSGNKPKKSKRSSFPPKRKSSPIEISD